MYSEPFEDYLTSEFNRTHAGLNDLIQAEKHSLDILDGQPNMASLLDDDHICHICYQPLGDDDPKDTTLCANHYSDWLWREAEQARGLRVSNIGDQYWIDYLNTRQPSYACSAGEADIVYKQIEGQYEILCNNHWTPEKKHGQMVAQMEAGDFEGLLYFEAEEQFKPFVRRHQRKAMEKGFELRGADNYHKLFALWLEQREECEPFHQRHCLYFDLYSHQWEDIPF